MATPPIQPLSTATTRAVHQQTDATPPTSKPTLPAISSSPFDANSCFDLPTDQQLICLINARPTVHCEGKQNLERTMTTIGKQMRLCIDKYADLMETKITRLFNRELLYEGNEALPNETTKIYLSMLLPTSPLIDIPQTGDPNASSFTSIVEAKKKALASALTTLETTVDTELRNTDYAYLFESGDAIKDSSLRDQEIELLPFGGKAILEQFILETDKAVECFHSDIKDKPPADVSITQREYDIFHKNPTLGSMAGVFVLIRTDKLGVKFLGN